MKIISVLASSWLQTAVVSVLIVSALSLDVMLFAYYSVLDYDLGKVIAYIDLYPGFRNYIDTLKFGQGIATQTYLLSLLVPLSSTLLKLGSYLFFVAAFTLVVMLVQIPSEGRIEKLVLGVIAALCTFVFFQSTTLRYLGSYGMLIYCEAFFISGLFLYYLRTYLFSGNALRYRVQLVWLPVFAIGTFLDIRFSFYLCIAHATALLFCFNDRQRFVSTFIAGTLAGIVIIPPIYNQFAQYSEIIGFRPHHILPFVYDGEYTLGSVTRFLVVNINRYLESLVGSSVFYKLGALFFVLLGVIHQLIQPTGRRLIAFLSVSLFILVCASVAGVYPFGSIRYTTHLFAFWVYLMVTGVVVVTGQIVSRMPNVFAKSSVAIVALLVVAWVQTPVVLNRVGLNMKLYAREIKVVEKLREIPIGNLWCDIATEKMVLGYHLDCNIVATWNYQSGKPETPAFYQSVDAGLSKMSGKAALFLFVPIETTFYEPIEAMLDKYRFKRKEEFHGSAKHLYIYEVLPRD